MDDAERVDGGTGSINFPVERPDKISVITAGMPRTGKSTGLNNIFGLNLTAKPSAKPVTNDVDTVKVERHGISLFVTDTPGLKSVEVAADDKKTMRGIKDAGVRDTFLLVLTLPVTVSSGISESYRSILIDITRLFGFEIWNWCIVLLTFSDTLVDDKEVNYWDFLKEHCKALESTLSQIGLKQEVILFDYETYNQFSKENHKVIAMPVARKSAFPTSKLYPQQSWTHPYKWTDIVFMELVKINDNIPEAKYYRSMLIEFRYRDLMTPAHKKAAIASTAGVLHGAVLGAAAGAGIGCTIGAFGGGLGIAPGALIGSAVGTVGGVIAGAVVFPSGTAAILKIKETIEKERNEEFLKEYVKKKKLE